MNGIIILRLQIFNNTIILQGSLKVASHIVWLYCFSKGWLMQFQFILHLTCTRVITTMENFNIILCNNFVSILENSIYQCTLQDFLHPWKNWLFLSNSFKGIIRDKKNAYIIYYLKIYYFKNNWTSSLKFNKIILSSHLFF